MFWITWHPNGPESLHFHLHNRITRRSQLGAGGLNVGLPVINVTPRNLCCYPVLS